MKTAIFTTALVTTLSAFAWAQPKYECKLLLEDNKGAFSIEMDKKELPVAPMAFVDMKGNQSELYRVVINEDGRFLQILNMDLENQKIDVNTVVSTDAKMITTVNTFWSYAISCVRQ